MGKVKKILAGVLVVVIAGSGITAGLMQLKKNSQKTVAVTPVSGLLQEFYTPSTTLDGTITSSATQTVNGDKDLIIDQIYVTKGDAVKKGDPLVSFEQCNSDDNDQYLVFCNPLSYLNHLFLLFFLYY